MEIDNQGVKCQKFLDTEAFIEETGDKVKEAKNFKEERYYIQDILFEIEDLLSCSNYNPGNPDCISCHSVSNKRLENLRYFAKGTKLYK